MHYISVRIYVIGLILLMNACALVPTAPSLWKQHQAQLQQLDSWQLSASIAAKGSDVGWQARLLWQYQPDSYYLRINAPLGQGAFNIRRYPDGHVSLKSADGHQYEANNAEQLLQDTLDLNLPLTALPYWIKGQLAPNLAVEQQEVDHQGFLRLLKQDHWQIEYSAYKIQTIAGKPYHLPHKIYLKKDDYFAKIVIATVSTYPNQP